MNHSKKMNFYNCSFFKKSDLRFRSKKSLFLQFWLIFYPLYPDPWIRIFLRIRIRIQETKILRIQRIRILSTAFFLHHALNNRNLRQTSSRLSIIMFIGTPYSSPMTWQKNNYPSNGGKISFCTCTPLTVPYTWLSMTRVHIIISRLHNIINEVHN